MTWARESANHAEGQMPCFVTESQRADVSCMDCSSPDNSCPAFFWSVWPT